jgi:hypothetical protein
MMAQKEWKRQGVSRFPWWRFTESHWSKAVMDECYKMGTYYIWNNSSGLYKWICIFRKRDKDGAWWVLMKPPKIFENYDNDPLQFLCLMKWLGDFEKKEESI